jgi:hypothetical protein
MNLESGSGTGSALMYRLSNVVSALVVGLRYKRSLKSGKVVLVGLVGLRPAER